MMSRLRNNLPKILVLSDQAVVSGSSFLTNIIIAHALGIEGYGKFSVIILIQLFLLSLQQAASSGIYQVMYARFETNIQHKYTNGLFYQQVLVYTILILLSCVFYLVLPKLTNGYETVFLPAILATLLFLLQDFLRKVLLTKQHEAKALIIDCITNGLQIGLLVVLAYYNMLTLSLSCWVIFGTFVPSVIVGIIWIKPGWINFSNIAFCLAQNKKQSSWMLLSALLQWFAGNFFVVAAGWWLGMAALGALRLAQYIFGLLNVLLQAIENYALPAASKLEASSLSLVRFVKRVLLKSILIMGPALLLIVIFAKQLLVLSGGVGYINYAYVMYGLTINYLVIVLGLPVRIALRVKLLSQHYFFGYAIATGFSLATANWLIGRWELSGVLCGLFCTQVIVIMYWLIILNKKKVFTWKLFTSY
jgi:O-antigen/teichoic acid export membrane protein